MVLRPLSALNDLSLGALSRRGRPGIPWGERTDVSPLRLSAQQAGKVLPARTRPVVRGARLKAEMTIDMNSRDALNRIVSGGFCIGCGACAHAAPEAIHIQFDRYGMYQAVLDPTRLEETTAADILQICPFSDSGPHEDQLAAGLYPDCAGDTAVGRYRGLYVGHAAEGEFRERGSSGGIVSWVLVELLSKGLVDGAIHVAPSGCPGERLFAYRISRSAEEVMQGAQSRYYPVELSEVLARVDSAEGRYALVGVPCFVKAARRLALRDATVRKRISCYIGLVCGHLKSKAFADCLAWQAGIAPGQLQRIDFRVKLPTGRASDYGVAVSREGLRKTNRASAYFGANWGYGFFKYSACEYCDDVFAETADLAVGDAWLPEYLEDWRGNSLVVTRSKPMEDLVRAARDAGRLHLQPCSAERMAASQAGGLRHRRDGLALRLLLKSQEGKWAPHKRVSPSRGGIAARRKRIYQLRELLRQRSHEVWIKAVQAGDFLLFESEMRRLVSRYDRAYASLPSRLARAVRRAIQRLWGTSSSSSLS